MGKIIAIDPGPKTSGVVMLETYPAPELPQILEAHKAYDNEELTDPEPDLYFCDHVAIEGIQSYGMAVGADVFETAEMIGRIRQAFGYHKTTKIYRKEVKLFLCGSLRAKDANVSQAIRDLYPATGGGKKPSVGTKAQPGPLYGVTDHAWSALAVGLTYLMTERTS